MRILFFTESLQTGGKERRLLELIQYLSLQGDYEIALVLTEDVIHYKYAYELNITLKIIKRKYIKYDPNLFFQFYSFCRHFKPDIIHTWGKMTTFYAIPAKLICRTPIVSNLIADSKRRFKSFSLDSFFFSASIFFSNILLSNSKAGLLAYKVKTPKAQVIYNGVHLERFTQEYNTKK